MLQSLSSSTKSFAGWLSSGIYIKHAEIFIFSIKNQIQKFVLIFDIAAGHIYVVVES